MRPVLACLLAAACGAAQRPPAGPTAGVPDVFSFDAPPGLEPIEQPEPEGQTVLHGWRVDDLRIHSAHGETANLLLPRDLPGALDYRYRQRPIDGRAARWVTFRWPASDEKRERFMAGFHVDGLTVLAEAGSAADRERALRILETARLATPGRAGSAATTSWRAYRYEPPSCRVVAPGARVTIVARDRLSRTRVGGAFVFMAGQGLLTDGDGRAGLGAVPAGAHVVEVLGNRGVVACPPLALAEGGGTIEVTFDAHEPE